MIATVLTAHSLKIMTQTQQTKHTLKGMVVNVGGDENDFTIICYSLYNSEIEERLRALGQGDGGEDDRQELDITAINSLFSCMGID
jgi:hypothetical protein